MVFMLSTIVTGGGEMRLAIARCLYALGVLFGVASAALAQPDVSHPRHAGALPPGAIGSQQLERGGPLPGYFQPVELQAPIGASISLAFDNHFSESMANPVRTGMLIGAVYRLRVTGIPRNEGAEVFPTIELVNRVYPPPGQEPRFPVPIDLTQEDIELALAGKFVTRVIYVEDPNRALPVAQKPGDQTWFEVLPHDNPLEVADRLGRPIAIVRIGGRVPDEATGPDAHFMFNSPPLLRPFTVMRKQTVLPEAILPKRNPRTDNEPRAEAATAEPLESTPGDAGDMPE